MPPGPISGSSSGLPKVMLSPVMREDDEAGCRHPVHEPLEALKAHDDAAGTAALDPHHAADEIEHDQQRQHAEDRDGADPAAASPRGTAASRGRGLLDGVGFGVGNGAAALDLVELLQQLLLLHRVGGRIDRVRLLRGDRRRDGDQ